MLKVIKKIVKWSAVGGALGAAYGAGRMNPPRKAGRFERWMTGKGKK